MANILMRVDASLKIGMGHLMRCLTIAAYFRSQGLNSLFILRDKENEKIIRRRGFEVSIVQRNESIQQEMAIIKRLAFDRHISKIILDINNHHTFQSSRQYNQYLEELKKIPLFLISFEDSKSISCIPDVVIIPYISADKLEINQEASCKYLLGGDYFPIREEFMRTEPTKIKETVESILITMGGSDPENITIKVLESINQTDLEIPLKIIMGGMTQIGNREIRDALKHYKGAYVIYKNVKNLGQLMASSDLAIISSGLTKYETAFMGLPSIVIALNDVHTEINDAFAIHGSIVNLGTYSRLNHSNISEAIISLTYDFRKRSKMSEAGRKLVDGKAIERIYDEISKELEYAKNYTGWK